MGEGCFVFVFCLFSTVVKADSCIFSGHFKAVFKVDFCNVFPAIFHSFAIFKMFLMLIHLTLVAISKVFRRLILVTFETFSKLINFTFLAVVKTLFDISGRFQAFCLFVFLFFCFLFVCLFCFVFC